MSIVDNIIVGSFISLAAAPFVVALNQASFFGGNIVSLNDTTDRKYKNIIHKEWLIGSTLNYFDEKDDKTISKYYFRPTRVLHNGSFI